MRQSGKRGASIAPASYRRRQGITFTPCSTGRQPRNLSLAPCLHLHSPRKCTAATVCNASAMRMGMDGPLAKYFLCVTAYASPSANSLSLCGSGAEPRLPRAPSSFPAHGLGGLTLNHLRCIDRLPRHTAYTYRTALGGDVVATNRLQLLQGSGRRTSRSGRRIYALRKTLQIPPTPTLPSSVLSITTPKNIYLTATRSQGNLTMHISVRVPRRHQRVLRTVPGEQICAPRAL